MKKIFLLVVVFLSLTYAQRFELDRNYMIVDSELKVKWFLSSTLKYDYNEAKNQCNKYGTRIPKSNEIKTLFKGDHPKIPFNMLANSTIWSSELLDDEFPYVFSFSGSGFHTFQKKISKHNVLCVVDY